MEGLRRKGKRPDNRPARGRYWSTHQLRKNKVRHIVKATGLTPREAQDLWESQRQGRRMKTNA